MVNFAHGWIGIHCPNDICGGCLHLDWEYFKHNGQFKISFSNCSLIPGQYTVSFVHSLHLIGPGVPHE